MQTIGIERNSKSTQVRRKKSNEPSAKELDVILYLQSRFPHIIEQILGHLVNDEAILKMAKVPRWSALFFCLLHQFGNFAGKEMWRNIRCGEYFLHGLNTASPSLPTNWMTTTTEICNITSMTAYGRLRITLQKDLTQNRSKASSISPQRKKRIGDLAASLSKMSELTINTFSLL